MRRTVCTLVLAVCSTFVSEAAFAQGADRFGVEGRLGVTAPIGQWNDDNSLNYGYSAGLNAQAWLTPSIGLYAGWDWNRFTVDRPDLNASVTATAIDTGFRGGVINPYRIRGSRLGTPYIFAGGMLNRTSYYLSDGRESRGVSSNNGLGYEVGAGLSMPIGPASALTPSIRYRTHQAVFGPPGGQGLNETTVSYIMIDVGIRVGM